MDLLTLKAEEIKRVISDKVGAPLAKINFVYSKAMNEFKCKRGDFTYIFNIDQVSWTNSISLHVRLYISQKKVEDILRKIIGKQRHKITLGQDIERIYRSPDGKQVLNADMSIWIRQDEDVEAAIDSLSWYFHDIALPYYRKYDSLQAIDIIMNNPPFDHCPADVGGNFDERCMKGLIVARLTSNPKYDQLVETYDEAIKETMNGESIKNYHKVREYLMYNRTAD